jgi:Protein of unknown function (DUF3038)
MSESNTEAISQNNIKSEAKSVLLELSDISGAGGGMMKVQQHLDLLMLALEALQLGASEYMLAIAGQLELNKMVKNRLSLWRLRCSNPWRKCYTRELLTLNEAKTLALITIESAKKFMIPIRQLILAAQQMEDKDMPLENNFRLSEYFSRFRSHFMSRMNPRRAKVSVYLSSEEELNKLALSLLEELLFCTGNRGKERFWVSLFDGEVN